MDPLLRYDAGSPPPSIPPYEIVRQIWRGRTADIFLATAPEGRRGKKNVVIRRLRHELAGEESFRTTFFLQGRLAVRLRHPNVVQTFEVRRDGNESLMVTELLEGHSLAHLRQRSKAVTAIPLGIHLRVLIAVLDGLEYLHASKEDEAPEGIVHGDVRPDNVFVTREGDVKLLHSGIESDDAATIVDERLRYMAPERARGDTPDRRSDLFSVGIMLWEAVTGLRFWQDWPGSAIFRRLSSEGLPVHSKWVPIAGRDLFDVAERALQKDPAARYASAKEMRDAIAGVLARATDALPPDAVRGYMLVASDGVDRSESEAPPSVGSGAISVQPMTLTPPTGLSIPGLASGRKRTYTVLGAAAILSGGWILGQAITRNAVDRPAIKRAPAACVDEVTQPKPAIPPPPAMSSGTIVDGEPRFPQAIPSATSVEIRTAAPPPPVRSKRPPYVDDRWGI